MGMQENICSTDRVRFSVSIYHSYLFNVLCYVARISVSIELSGVLSILSKECH